METTDTEAYQVERTEHYWKTVYFRGNVGGHQSPSSHFRKMSENTSVTVVSPDLSSNCLGRAHVIADLLKRNFEVEIAGPMIGETVWEPLADEWSYDELNITNETFKFARRSRSVVEQLQGDVIFAVKPKMTSFGLGLLSRYLDDTPLLLDIDDWETGSSYQSPVRTRLRAIPEMYYVNSFIPTRTLEALSGLADARTVSNEFLQKRFGGTIVPHVRDTETFDPDRYDKLAIREDLGLPKDKTIVMFSGTPRPHKGVDDLIAAVNSIDDEVVAVVVGVHDSQYVRSLREMAGDDVRFFGRQPFDEIPRWIAASDIVAIPQKETRANWGQLPAKVFDAMAMGKPVVATNISDLPQVLENCGLLVDPGSPNALAKQITYLHTNTEERGRLGNAARSHCVDQYSYDALVPKMTRVVEEAMSNHEGA